MALGLGSWAEVREGQLRASGDHTLFHKSWLPKHGAAPSAHIVYFAGVHESLELTAVERIVAAAVPRGWAVHGHEYHGHGRSTKMKGYVEGLDVLLEHCTAYMDLVMRETERNAPVFVMGHSMGGGLIALLGDAWCERYGARFRGAVLWSPALGSPEVMPAVMLCVLRVLCWLWPSAKLGPPEDPYSSFAVLDEADKYAACEHNYIGNMRLSTGKMFVDEMFPRIHNALMTGELRASFPFLIVHSVGDPVPIAPCHTLMRAAATPDKELLELDGASHQILSDPAWEEPLDHAIRWIQQRIDELPQPPVVANQ